MSTTSQVSQRAVRFKELSADLKLASWLEGCMSPLSGASETIASYEGLARNVRNTIGRRDAKETAWFDKMPLEQSSRELASVPDIEVERTMPPLVTEFLKGRTDAHWEQAKQECAAAEKEWLGQNVFRLANKYGVGM